MNELVEFRVGENKIISIAVNELVEFRVGEKKIISTTVNELVEFRVGKRKLLTYRSRSKELKINFNREKHH